MVASSRSHRAQPAFGASSFFWNRPRFGFGRAFRRFTVSFRWEDSSSASPSRLFRSKSIFRCFAQNPFSLTSCRVDTSITDPPRK